MALPKHRVLIIHNRYRHRGGEDTVVEAELELLRRKGHTVELLERHNDELDLINRVTVAAHTLWSPQTVRDVESISARFKPDVIHVHNCVPLISPSVFWAAHRAGVPTVQTLHNFRVLCPQAMFLRNGKVCEACLGNVPWRAVWHACYRGSVTQSAVMLGMLQAHRVIGTWRTGVDCYIALNAFCRAKFVEGGLPSERISIKPNFVDLPAPLPRQREGFLYVGRLSEEKGIHVLAKAWRQSQPALFLSVAGSGPLENVLSGTAGVTMLGALSFAAVIERMTSATALVMPSICYENFPRTLVEAFACGLPVISTRIGALAQLVEHGKTGLLAEPGDAVDLARQVAWAARHPEALLEMGRNARRHYELNWTGDVNYKQLVAIYDHVIATFGMRKA
jgi:glycosyltransferase involved in cell wall biosynthesis